MLFHRKTCSLYLIHFAHFANSSISVLIMLIVDEEQDTSSEDEVEDEIAEELINDLAMKTKRRKVRGGSRVGRSPNLKRSRATANDILTGDYFVMPLYPEIKFRRRFRISMDVFSNIRTALLTDSYFNLRNDALGVPGLSTEQKLTCALRILAYGNTPDAQDEYLKIGESTAHQIFHKFCKDVVEILGPKYLRTPTKTDLMRVLAMHAVSGWIGLFGALDCVHWEYHACPKMNQGSFQGRDGKRSLVSEVVCDETNYIWHVNACLPGSLNDINVFQRSTLWADMIRGPASQVRYKINNREYQYPYLITDGIYPDYGIIVKSVAEPQGPEKCLFATLQESKRK
jgi:hypothetical protein